jgi:hypothetical protein
MVFIKGNYNMKKKKKAKALAGIATTINTLNQSELDRLAILRDKGFTVIVVKSNDSLILPINAVIAPITQWNWSLDLKLSVEEYVCIGFVKSRDAVRFKMGCGAEFVDL